MVKLKSILSQFIDSTLAIFSRAVRPEERAQHASEGLDLEQKIEVTFARLYEKNPPPNPRGEDRGVHVRSPNICY
jgi:hypothetical protein